ncbi:54S ribosomal protein L4-like protein [Emericellopsis cladophorae]|uniref:Large ribosomal subunit protein uL29m n=1 Tax=Emericellopsis cladophorae TaxID=2686198 RepID=A0A9P9Y8N1_9HYPO|nr:54S ribosomal protein L4-like protein [Emericellopsis cladophorae]KAI6785108.1 54S ribosomal protein L4-like protein [Emericellopsis cladophorae]
MANPSSLWHTAGRVAQSTGRSLATPSLTSQSTARFSTSAHLCKRKRRATNRDNNPNRGVSSIYRSGPREPLSMSDIPLPRPREFTPKVEVDKDHGLWGFFPRPGTCLMTPEETEKYGRSWTAEELRRKGWEDLHKLWWQCCRERNMLSTSIKELKRSKLGFGQSELEQRDLTVQATMRNIKAVLTERYYTWEDAQAVAAIDPEIDLQAVDGSAYNPGSYVDEFEANEDAWAGNKDALPDAPEFDNPAKEEAKAEKKLQS